MGGLLGDEKCHVWLLPSFRLKPTNAATDMAEHWLTRWER